MTPIVSQNEAARLADVSVCQIYVWRRQGRIEPVGHRHCGGPHPMILLDADAVLEQADWSRRSLSETAAAKFLGVEPGTLHTLAERGDLGETRHYDGRWEYSREGLERYAELRKRLLTLREVSRQFGLSWWVLRELISADAIETRPGPKHSRLVDPLQLKPLLVAQPCDICGELLPPGWTHHFKCLSRRPEARERIGQRISEWWRSEAAAEFREKIQELGCPTCGSTFRLPEHRVRGREQRMRERRAADAVSIFCSRSCAAKSRWVDGGGLNAFVRKLPPHYRQVWFGRWNGHKGAEAGIEAGRAKGGRPPLLNAAQQQEIYELHKSGLSSRRIAEEVLDDARLYKRVQRYLAR